MTNLYKFCDPQFGKGGNTVVSAAPLDVVVRTFGGGGIRSTGGLSAVFGGAIVFQNDGESDCYVGVWGARKAAKFRTAIKNVEKEVTVIEGRPPARLRWHQTQSKRKR